MSLQCPYKMPTGVSHLSDSWLAFAGSVWIILKTWHYINYVHVAFTSLTYWQNSSCKKCWRLHHIVQVAISRTIFDLISKSHSNYKDQYTVLVVSHHEKPLFSTAECDQKKQLCHGSVKRLLKLSHCFGCLFFRPEMYFSYSMVSKVWSFWLHKPIQDWK